MTGERDTEARIRAHFRDSIAAKERAADALPAAIARAGERLVQVLSAGGKILTCGNGGSAADAQHFASELVGRLEAERPGHAALALTTDPSTLTSVANDYGYDAIFARQIEALGARGDALLAITTSGDSANVVQAVDAARDRGLSVIALTGAEGGKLALRLGPDDLEIRVPETRTMRIQEVHLLVVHCLCDAVDAGIGASPA